MAKFGNVIGKTSEAKACPAGCPAGKHQEDASIGNTDASSCTGKCPKGTFQIDASTGNIDALKCTGKCPQGKWSGTPGLASDLGCGLCPAGTFSIAVGLTFAENCTKCPLGKSVLTQGSASEQSCEVLPAIVTATNSSCSSSVCPIDGGSNTLLITGSNFKDSMTITVGGVACSSIDFFASSGVTALAVTASEVSCTLPRTAGGNMLIRIDGDLVPSSVTGGNFVSYVCASGSGSNGVGGCELTPLVAIEAPAQPCEGAASDATQGCNNDIVTPEGYAQLYCFLFYI